MDPAWSARVLVTGGGPTAYALHLLGSGGVRLRPSACGAPATPWLARGPGAGHAVLVQKAAGGGSCVRTGTVAAATGALAVADDTEHALGGSDPVHGAVDPHTGRCVAVAHGGDVRLLALELVPDGGGGERLQPVGPVVVLPVGGKCSQALWHPALRGVLYATHLAGDRLLRYSVTYAGAAAGGVAAALEAATPLPPGSGPRRMLLDARGTTAYVINELAATVAVLDVCPASGALALVETHSSLPPGAPRAGVTSAQLALSPDGGTLLASNRSDRGEDSIAAFAVCAGGGGGGGGGGAPRLRPAGWATPATAAADLGWPPAHPSYRDALRVPRDMTVLAVAAAAAAGGDSERRGGAGCLLLVANQAAESLTLFRVGAREAGGGGPPLTALQAIPLPAGAQPTCVVQVG
jgi:hypothetical protein